MVQSPPINFSKLSTAFENGDAYDVEIASKRVHEDVQGILNKTSSFNIDQILFIGGNDILHIDNAKRTTTSNTPQDTDAMWYENCLTAKDVIVEFFTAL